MSNVSDMVETIKKLKCVQVVRNELVRQQFINVYNAIWKHDGEQVYEREANFFNKLIRESEYLRACTPLSVFFAFIDLAVQGISVEPGARALAYLIPRGYKTDKVDGNGKNIYENHCVLNISGQGELYLRARAGQIHHADNPVVVYEGDDFEFGERDGRKYVNYCMRMPRTSNHIVACFMKITRTDGTIDYAVMVESDWIRLSGYSAENNKKWDYQRKQWVKNPNALYTSEAGGIDPGFLRSKCIKHAFGSYPKLNIGKGTQLETVTCDLPDPGFDPYGGVGEEGTAQQEASHNENDSFASTDNTASGVRIDPAAKQQENGTGTQNAATATAEDDVF